MTEWAKTTACIAAAVLCVALAWFASPRQAGHVEAADRGQRFFPGFTDPNAATSLEIIAFDEHSLAARAFKVLNRGGHWTIPSHDNYPADGATRLSSIAAAVIALQKDERVSESLADAERCGVLDPADETLATASGRGTRVTVRGVNEKVLADIIIGKTVEARPEFRYVRLPDQKRIYVARVERLDVSTAFHDWVERNLLQVDRSEIDQILIRNYSTDGSSGRIAEREMIVLRRRGRDEWTAAGLAPSEAIDSFTMNLIVTRLVDLSLVDVRPKPPGMVATLAGTTPERRFSAADVADLAARGFYFTADGQMVSNDGEVVVHTSSGIFYVLRFGEVASGAPDSRNLFVSVGFDPPASSASPPDEVRDKLDRLRSRFAAWYYLVANEDVRKIRVARSSLIAKTVKRP
jgi:hypothetical protein